MTAPRAGELLVRAHPGLPPQPHDLLTAWAWEPLALLGLLLGAWLYGRGVRRLWRRAGPGRGIARWRVLAFGGGLLVLGAALLPPLTALGSALFSAHMLQHVLLVVAAAPLLVLGRPETALLWALPRPARRRLGGWWRRRRRLRAGWHALTGPPAAWALHAAATWLWHLPGPYQAALASDVVHLAEHLGFLLTALLFWRVLPGSGVRARLHPAVAVLYLFGFTLQGGILGALMTFAGEPWYPVYAATAPAWGLTPLEDQQLAGLVMWIPSGLVYAVAALVPLFWWLEAGEESPRRLEHEHA